MRILSTSTTHFVNRWGKYLTNNLDFNLEVSAGGGSRRSQHAGSEEAPSNTSGGDERFKIENPEKRSEGCGDISPRSSV